MADSLKLKLYVTGSSFDRYKILKELNSKELKYFSIPAMISLSEHFKENYNEFMALLKDQFEVNSDESSYAAFKVSEYALKNSYICDAEFFAMKSLEFIERPGREVILMENLDKIRWIKERLN